MAQAGRLTVVRDEVPVQSFAERRVNLLLVDDHAENLLALRSILEPLGHTLVDAHSGDEALRRLLETDFAVILLDVMMPGLDGFETAAHIKQREKTRDVPIIFLTAISREPHQALRGYSTGAVDYISKPFDPWVLRAKVSVFVELYEKNRMLKQEAEVRRQAELALQRQVDLYESLLRAQSELAQGVAIIDSRTGRFVYANDALSRIHGYSTSELKRRSLTSLLAPEERLTVRRITSGFDSGRSPGVHFEAAGLRKDGSRIDIEIAIQPIDGSRFVTLIRDVGERKRAEEALREAERRYHGIFENAVEGILQSTFDGKVLAANPAAARILGYDSPEQMLAMRRVRLHVDPVREVEFVRQIRERGSTEGFELQSRRPDGRMIWLAISARALVDEEGEATGFEGTIADVTERKRLETFRDDFVANAAHELRTPIAALTGFSALLAGRWRTLSDESMESIIQALERQGGRIETLIQNLLDLTRLQQGHLDVRIEAVPLANAVKQAVEEAPPPRGKSVEARVDPDAEALADPVMLDQVLINLLSNAYRYGGDHVHIESETSEDGAAIAVADDGSGVPEELVAHLFDAFARGTNALDAGGSGLGLAICRTLVEACGGLIQYEPRDPRGSRFVILLRSP